MENRRTRKVAVAIMLTFTLLGGGTLASTANVSAAKATTATSVSHAATAQRISSAPRQTVAVTSFRRPAGAWVWFGFRLTRAETNQIANIPLWNAYSAPGFIRLIGGSQAARFSSAFAVGWVLTAYNARSLGLCLGITWIGIGQIVNCA
jgi:hypothetical protein